MPEKKRVLVTGGAGFIGSHIVARHLIAGDEVWAIDNLHSGRMENIAFCNFNPHFKFSQADICDWPEMKEAVKWADRIYHMASYVGQWMVLKQPIATLTNNIYGTESVLSAMGDTKSAARLIIASTSSVYCHNKVGPDGMVSETDTLSIPSGKFRQECYLTSKLIGEVFALSYAYEKEIHCTLARIFNTVGVNQSPAYGMVVPNFVEKALLQQPINVFGDGEQSRSFSDVRDTVRALSLLLESPEAKGEIVNVGDDRECSINDLADLVKRLTHSHSEIRHISYEEAYGVDFVDVRRRRPDLRKLRRLTDFQPQYSITDTIEQVILSVKKRLQLV